MLFPLALLLALSLLTPAAEAQSSRRPNAAVKTRPAPAPAPPAAPRCGDDEVLKSAEAADPNWSPLDPRSYLLQLADTARQRSRQVGVARLLEQAAQDEVREAEAARLPELQLQFSAGQAGSMTLGQQGPQGLEGRASLQLSGPLWDWGQTRQLIEWRRQLVEVAAAGRASAAEQIALQTVALSLDRSRYTLQAQVYGQYVRKMACLVEQLQTITQFDQGRASELVQAKKSQQQAELALATTREFVKSVETRLRRLVGEPLPAPGSLSAVLARVPELGQLQKELLLAPDVSQANAQALASSRLAESVAAGQKPRLSYIGSANARAGNGRYGDWVAGVQLSIPLLRAGDEPQLAAARRRAEAANLQRDETLEAKSWRLQEVHEAAGDSLDRARRITELLRSSQQLRSATLLQWQQLGRRSLFDVMNAEADYYALRIAHVNALYDAQQAVALMGSMGRGVTALLD